VVYFFNYLLDCIAKCVTIVESSAKILAAIITLLVLVIVIETFESNS